MATLATFRTLDLARAAVAALAARDAALNAAQDLTVALALERAGGESLRAADTALREAQARLGRIALPADGTPELWAMEQALIARANAQAAVAATARMAQQAAADASARRRAQRAADDAASAAREAALREAGDGTPAQPGAAAARAALAASLRGGEGAALAAVAAQALADHEAPARARVEGEFPAAADPVGDRDRDMLAVTRQRRALAAAANTSAQARTADAATAAVPAVQRAQWVFEAALAAARAADAAGSRLAEDVALLVGYAALPAPTATARPLLTLWQHARLHDAALRSGREDALSALSSADALAEIAQDTAAALALARDAARRADPDASASSIEGLPSVVTAREGWEEARDDHAAARSALAAPRPGPPGDPDLPSLLQVVQAWLAAVPDALWRAHESLDAATARLRAIAGPPASAVLADALEAAEDNFVTALAAAEAAARSAELGRGQFEDASAALSAAQATAAARGRALGRSAAAP